MEFNSDKIQIVFDLTKEKKHSIQKDLIMLWNFKQDIKIIVMTYKKGEKRRKN